MEYLKMILSIIGTGCVYIFGGLDVALQCFLIAIVLDYITGLCKAYVTKKLNSKIGLKGIIKKVGLLCLVALAVILDRICGETGLIRTMILYYLVANEGLSIIENLGEMDIIVPQFLKDKLEQLKDKGSEK